MSFENAEIQEKWLQMCCGLLPLNATSKRLPGFPQITLEVVILIAELNRTQSTD